MRFFNMCCADESDVGVGSRRVVRHETIKIKIEIFWDGQDTIDFKKMDERIAHTDGWHQQGDLAQTVISIPKSCTNEIILKLKTTAETGITAVDDVKTEFGLVFLQLQLITAKAIKAIDDADHQNAMGSLPASRPAM